MDPIIVAVIAVVAAVIVAFLARRRAKPVAADDDNDDAMTKETKQPRQVLADGKSANKKKKAPAKKAPAVSEELLLCHLKGHTGDVLATAFSPDGQRVVSVSSDRTIRLWPVKQTVANTCARVNVDLDTPSSLSFSPDATAMLVGLESSRCSRLFKVGKKETSPVMDIPKVAPCAAELVGAALAASDKYKYIVLAYSNTMLYLYSVKGDLLQEIDTKMMTNTYATVSPCGKFFACSGFSTHVRLWEFQPQAEHGKSAEPAMDLTGHTSGIYHFAFNPDSTRVATVSKDGTWRLYDIDVNYKLREDPKTLCTGTFPKSESATPSICMSPDGLVVVIGNDSSLYFYDAVGEGTLLHTIENAHPKGVVTSVSCSNESRCIASGGTDKVVRLWYNLPGFNLKLQGLEKDLQKNFKAKDVVKNRIQKQIEETKKLIALVKSS